MLPQKVDRFAAAISTAFALVFLRAQALAATIEVGRGPGKVPTIQVAVERARAGDAVLIHDGVYREAVYVRVSGAAAQPIAIQAAPGAHPVITGADPIPLDQWQPVVHAHIWWHKPWTYHAPSRLIDGSTFVTEQVIEDGKPLARVPSSAGMTQGTFFADPDSARALYVLAREKIEAVELVTASQRLRAAVEAL